MREITNFDNARHLKIEASEPREEDRSVTHYAICNVSSDQELCTVDFMAYPGDENGVTHEALLAIVIDRLENFQKGPYACRENALALTKLQEAQHWFWHRTADREDRGVLGTYEK